MDHTTIIIIGVIVILIAILMTLLYKSAKSRNRSGHWMWWAIHPIFGLIALAVLLKKPPLSIGEDGKVIPDKKERLEKATTLDVIISIFLPGWGLIVGALAFFIKGEKKRGATMMIIGAIILFLLIISGNFGSPQH
jgi:hypothetical protein